MARSKKKKATQATESIGDFAEELKNNPYVQKVMQDAELQESIRSAYDTTRSAYDRLNSSKKPGKALVKDKKLQGELQEAAAKLSDISTTLRDAPKAKAKKAKKGGGLGRKLLLVAVGAGLAISLSEGLRKKVLDALFGAEEEFDYTSTTTPAPAPVSTPA